MSLRLPNSLRGAFPDGDVPESIARLVKVSARPITTETVKEFLKVPGTAHSLLICVRAAERTLRGTSGNWFILGLAYFMASELHRSKRYILPESPEGLEFIQGDASLKERHMKTVKTQAKSLQHPKWPSFTNILVRMQSRLRCASYTGASPCGYS